MPGEVTQTSVPDGHILFVNMFAWGHTVASLNLASKVVRFRPVYVTVAVPDALFDKSIAMLDGLFTNDGQLEHALRALVRVVGISWANSMDEVEPAANYKEVFKAAYEMTPIPLHTGSTSMLPIVPRPKLVIVDFSLLSAMHAVREVADSSSVKVFALQSAGVSGSLLLGPKEEGKPGVGDLSEMVGSIMAEGLDFAEANAKMDKAYHHQDGAILYHPGLPPVYDYEIIPQKSILPFSLAIPLQRVQQFLKECDGVIHGTSEILEKDALVEFARVFNSNPETSINAGPFAFPIRKAPWDVKIPSAADARALLDRALHEKGPRSVIYISLGSAFWTTEPEKMWVIINTLLDRGIYLLFSHASPFAVVPEDLKARLEASEFAFHSTWLPQTQILEHEACGWFLTHCGENSYGETVSAGVPVICMPLEGDQPHNAIYATDVHRIGYELYNARNGPGLGPIHRKNGWAPEGTVEALKKEFEDILEKAFGDDGDEKRKNAQKYRALLEQSWKEEGQSWKELEKLFKYVI